MMKVEGRSQRISAELPPLTVPGENVMENERFLTRNDVEEMNAPAAAAPTNPRPVLLVQLALP